MARCTKRPATWSEQGSPHEKKWLRNFKRYLLQPEVEFIDIEMARTAQRR